MHQELSVPLPTPRVLLIFIGWSRSASRMLVHCQEAVLRLERDCQSDCVTCKACCHGQWLIGNVVLLLVKWWGDLSTQWDDASTIDTVIG